MEKNKTKIYIYTSTECSRRLLDAYKIKEYCEQNGYEITSNPREADFLILNSCASHKLTEDYSIDTVKKLKKMKGTLIVCGCLPAINKSRLQEIFTGQIFTPTTLQEIEKIIPKKSVSFLDIAEPHYFYQSLSPFKKLPIQPADDSPMTNTKNIVRRLLKEHPTLKNHLSKMIIPKGDHYYYIKISYGCPGNCSYCAIKRAIGRLVSKPLDQCISELKEGLRKGYSNIMLVGDDTGAYGTDIGTDFPTLLENMLKIPGNFTLHLGETNPIWINLYESKLKKIVLSKKIKQLIVPIQSANKEILKQMRRNIDIDLTKQILLDMKKIRPDIILETHCIVGFPGETMQNFNETLQYIKDMHFSWVWINKFTAQKGTYAAILPDQIPSKVVSRRVAKAEKLFLELGIDFNRQRIKRPL